MSWRCHFLTLPYNYKLKHRDNSLLLDAGHHKLLGRIVHYNIIHEVSYNGTCSIKLRFYDLNLMMLFISVYLLEIHI